MTITPCECFPSRKPDGGVFFWFDGGFGGSDSPAEGPRYRAIDPKRLRPSLDSTANPFGTLYVAKARGVGFYPSDTCMASSRAALRVTDYFDGGRVARVL
jgi:hypothetical protein